MSEENHWVGPADRMPEAEVALRLAMYLCEQHGFEARVDVAIDGASVRVQDQQIFDIVGFLDAHEWRPRDQFSKSKNHWAKEYSRGDCLMKVHSSPGVGDVEARIAGRRLIAECKKGPLLRKPGSQEYSLLTSAIGQALLFRAAADDIVVAAVPDTPAFRRIASDWSQRPRLIQSGIQIALVNRSGQVSGLDLSI